MCIQSLLRNFRHNTLVIIIIHFKVIEYNISVSKIILCNLVAKIARPRKIVNEESHF